MAQSGPNWPTFPARNSDTPLLPHSSGTLYPLRTQHSALRTASPPPPPLSPPCLFPPPSPPPPRPLQSGHIQLPHPQQRPHHPFRPARRLVAQQLRENRRYDLPR